MTLEHGIALRLKFLTRVVRKECLHLTGTDQRLFKARLSISPQTHPNLPLPWEKLFWFFP